MSAEQWYFPLRSDVVLFDLDSLPTSEPYFHCTTNVYQMTLAGIKIMSPFRWTLWTLTKTYQVNGDSDWTVLILIGEGNHILEARSLHLERAAKH